MRHLMLAAFAVTLTACFSAHSKPPVTQVAQSPASLCGTQGPLFVINGVVQSSTCGTAKEGQSPKCDSTAPRYVVNGVPLFDGDSTCAKPESPSNDTRR